MLVTKRKSKYKTKVEFPKDWDWTNATTAATRSVIMREWCEGRFGPGGRKSRWRFGWTNLTSTFYFKQEKDATMFVLRWCNEN
jgi:hypothetical protein